MRRDARIRLALVLLALPLTVAGCGYNQIQADDEAVKAAWAEVGNQYQRRADLIPNLVKTVQGAADFERETLEAVIQARARATSIQATPELLQDPDAFARFEQAQGSLSGALSRLLVAVERYPELQASQSFRDLQAQLEGTENRIAVARKRYIEAVQAYNTLVRSFPTLITARVIGAGPKPSFTPRADVGDTPPEVQF